MLSAQKQDGGQAGRDVFSRTQGYVCFCGFPPIQSKSCQECQDQTYSPRRRRLPQGNSETRLCLSLGLVDTDSSPRSESKVDSRICVFLWIPTHPEQVLPGVPGPDLFSARRRRLPQGNSETRLCLSLGLVDTDSSPRSESKVCV